MFSNEQEPKCQFEKHLSPTKIDELDNKQRKNKSVPCVETVSKASKLLLGMELFKSYTLWCRSNAKHSRKLFQKNALDSLVDVRREVLQKVFGEDYEKSSYLQKQLQLEKQVHQMQSELLDRELAFCKLQTWYKLRSKAFQNHCEKLVNVANDKVRLVLMFMQD